MKTCLNTKRSSLSVAPLSFSLFTVHYSLTKVKASKLERTRAKPAKTDRVPCTRSYPVPLQTL